MPCDKVLNAICGWLLSHGTLSTILFYMMRISDPATAITDYALAIESFAFAVILLQQQSGRWSVFLWALAFVMLVLSAGAGGVYHHLRLDLSTVSKQKLWKVTAFPMTAAFALFLCGGIYASLSSPWKWIVIALIGAGFSIAVLFFKPSTAERSGAKRSVAILTMVLIALLGLLLQQWISNGARSGINILIGSILCAAGTLVQQSVIKIHKHFNHNDVCHVLFMIGLYFLFTGGLLLKDK